MSVTFIQTAECAIIVIGAIQLTKRMQIFFDTGAKFREFPQRYRIAEESFIYDNLLNNKRITKRHICYMLILWNNTLFKLFQNEGLNKLG